MYTVQIEPYTVHIEPYTVHLKYSGDAIYTPDEPWCSSPDTGGGGGLEQRHEGGLNATTGAVLPVTTPATSATTSPVMQRKLHLSGSDNTGFSGTSGTTAAAATDFTESLGSGGSLSNALEGDESAVQIQLWLKHHRFTSLAATFANFTATDILRLSRSELIEICGLADGIRLFNTLHAKIHQSPGNCPRPLVSSSDLFSPLRSFGPFF
ncbi:hypothetical protein FHG87_024841 [Trinorchestia longiramus]|nr:hypothetical protein FHG87_024841 [Trinorchestia longiramus]